MSAVWHSDWRRGWPHTARCAFATRRDDGSVRLLLTAFGAKDALRLKVKGADLRQATVVVEKGEPAPFTGFTFADGELRLTKPAQDAVYLFRN